MFSYAPLVAGLLRLVSDTTVRLLAGDSRLQSHPFVASIGKLSLDMFRAANQSQTP
jgi:hypothetical protein